MMSMTVLFSPHCPGFCWAGPALPEYGCPHLLAITAWQPAKSTSGDIPEQPTNSHYSTGSVMTWTRAKMGAPKLFLPIEITVIEHTSLFCLLEKETD